jgi:hypothetical protein
VVRHIQHRGGNHQNAIFTSRQDVQRQNDRWENQVRSCFAQHVSWDSLHSKYGQCCLVYHANGTECSQVENASPQQTAISPSLNPPSPSSNDSSPNNVQMPFPPYPGYYGLPGYPILPMMPPPMGWNSPQPPHLFQQNYNTQHGHYQEGHYRNNNNNNNNRKRFNNNGAKYPQTIQQESSPQDRASTFSQQPGNFRNHTKKNNYRSQYNHGNNNNTFKNNNRTQQQTSRYNSAINSGNSIEESPVNQSGIQHELPILTPPISDASSERPSYTPKGSSMPKNRGKKKKSDKKHSGKLLCALTISDTSGHKCQQTPPMPTFDINFVCLLYFFYRNFLLAARSFPSLAQVYVF